MKPGSVITHDTRTFLVLTSNPVLIAPITAPRTPSRVGDIALPVGTICRVGSHCKPDQTPWLTVGIIDAATLAACHRALARCFEAAQLIRKHAPLGDYEIAGNARSGCGTGAS